MTTIALSAEEDAVLAQLARASYQDVSTTTGWSRGKIHRLALRAGARKTEARIRERAAERIARQRDLLDTIINESVTADVLDFLEGVESNTAQLIVTSVPYNVGKKYGDAAGADTMRHLYYAGWLRQIVSELARIVKPTGTIFLQSGATKDDDGSLVPIDVMLFDDLRRAGLTYRNRIIWPASHGLTPKNRLAERYETVLVFSKGDQAWNPDAARTPQLQPGKRGYKKTRANYGELTGHPLGAAGTDMWWDIRHLKPNDAEATSHPAAFPIALAKKAILTYSRPGDLVIDPFVGSGSTQIAAVQTQRSFIGADLFYEDLRRERLSCVVPDLVTRLPGVSDTSLAVWQAEARRKDVPYLPLSESSS